MIRSSITERKYPALRQCWITVPQRWPSKSAEIHSESSCSKNPTVCECKSPRSVDLRKYGRISAVLQNGKTRCSVSNGLIIGSRVQYPSVLAMPVHAGTSMKSRRLTSASRKSAHRPYGEAVRLRLWEGQIGVVTR